MPIGGGEGTTEYRLTGENIKESVNMTVQEDERTRRVHL